MHDDATRLRFWKKVDRGGPGGCWIWTAAVNQDGYGQFHIGYRQFRAHRVAYEIVRGPIPVGMQIDHLCRVRSCVNPSHLEPVTGRVNTARSPIAPSTVNAAKTHCKHGHEFTPENTYRQTGGYRGCRECGKRLSREQARRRKGVTPDRYRV